jgi:hypothetical protein
MPTFLDLEAQQCVVNTCNLCTQVVKQKWLVSGECKNMGGFGLTISFDDVAMAGVVAPKEVSAVMAVANAMVPWWFWQCGLGVEALKAKAQ